METKDLINILIVIALVLFIIFMIYSISSSRKVNQILGTIESGVNTVSSGIRKGVNTLSGVEPYITVDDADKEDPYMMV